MYYTSKEQEPKVKYDVFSIFINYNNAVLRRKNVCADRHGVVEGISWMVQ